MKQPKKRGSAAQARRRARRQANRVAATLVAAAIPEDANYRPATGADTCGNCSHFSSGQCDLWDAAVESDYTCDSWEAAAAASSMSPAQALAAVRRYADENMPCANCGHSMSVHEDDGCMSEGCTCDGFVAETAAADTEETADDAMTLQILLGGEIISERHLTMTMDRDVARLRLENITFDLSQPTRDDRLGLRWTADFVPEGVLTDDHRAMAPGSLSWRELPLTLMAMLETQDAHDGARVSGRIDQIWRDGSMIKGAGVFDNGAFGVDVARLVDDRTLRGISVDIAVSKHEVGPKSDFFDEDGNWAPRDTTSDEAPALADLLFDEQDVVFVVTEGVIGAVTVCPFPAFADASISLAASLQAGADASLWTFTGQNSFAITEQPCLCAAGEPHICGGDNAASHEHEGGSIEGGFIYCAVDGCTARSPISDEDAAEWIWGTSPVPAVDAMTAAAAGLAPLAPPADWFANPELTELTPLTIDDEGRIYGHAWAWDTCHLAYPDSCTTAPHSNTEYAYFLLKEVLCDDGSRVPCGTITLDTGHAEKSLGRAAATAHYDDTGFAAADVAFGEDEHGGWVAGALRPDIDAEKARVLRGAVLSGDWRNVNGNLELVGLLAVNVPGFPVPRPRALIAAGEDGEQETLALVAAGTVIGKTTAGVTDADLERVAQLHARAALGRVAGLAARARDAA